MKNTKLEKSADMELRIKQLLLNAFESKSGITLADAAVLKEIAKRLGFTKTQLRKELL